MELNMLKNLFRKQEKDRLYSRSNRKVILPSISNEGCVKVLPVTGHEGPEGY